MDWHRHLPAFFPFTKTSDPQPNVRPLWVPTLRAIFQALAGSLTSASQLYANSVRRSLGQARGSRGSRT